jgi:hypothetical protein
MSLASAPTRGRSPLDYLKPGARSAASSTLARVAAIRSDESPGKLLDMLLALDAAGGRAAPPVPTLPTPTTSELSTVRSLPPSLRYPVAGLLAAVEEARLKLGGQLPAKEVVPEIEQLLSGLPTLASRAASAPAGARETSPVVAHPAVARKTVPLVGPVTLGPATRHAVEQDPEVSLLIAEAIDRYLPDLRQAALEMAHPTRASDPCNLLDEPPLLCVASADGTTFSTSYVLLIDLGGNSTFLDSAGAAPFAPGPSATSYEPVSVAQHRAGRARMRTSLPSATSYEPVSVALAVGPGDDSFTAPALPVLGGQTYFNVSGFYGAVTLGDGAGAVGGVGFLVDDSGGASTFTAHAPAVPTTTSYPAAVMGTIAEGAGALGEGFLVKYGGPATFSAVGPDTSGRVYSGVFAQGDGQFDPEDGCAVLQGYCSEGALIDLGGGDDTYAIDAGAAIQSAPTYAIMGGDGQGAGWGPGGGGFLVDDGGNDTFTESVSASTNDHTSGLLPFDGPYISLTGQGHGDLGVGMLVEGSGTHSYKIDAQAKSLGVQTYEVAGQGTGALGVGVLDDEGTAATYDISEHMTDNHHFVVGAGCGCSVPEISVNGVNAGHFNPSTVYGQGSAFGGLGLLYNAGRGSYTADLVEDVHDSLADNLAHPSAPGFINVIGLQEGFFVAQGAVVPDVESPSYGILINEGGMQGGATTPSRFTALNSDTVETSATSASGAPPKASGTVPFQFDYSADQGAAVWNSLCPCVDQGALIDYGGPGDVFHATESHSVTTNPDTGGDYASGAFWDPMQGNGDGALFVAAGGAAQVSASPANGVCPGSPDSSGFGEWTTCGYYSVQGVNDADHTDYDYTAGDNAGEGLGLAEGTTGAAPTLTIVSAPSSATDGTEVPVTVKLEDATGKPIAGAVVRLDAQIGLPVPSPLFQWINVTQAEGTTRSDGTAIIDLPIAYAHMIGGLANVSGAVFEILATYDGGGGLYPKHAVAPLSVSFGPSPSHPRTDRRAVRARG